MFSSIDFTRHEKKKKPHHWYSLHPNKSNDIDLYSDVLGSGALAVELRLRIESVVVNQYKNGLPKCSKHILTAIKMWFPFLSKVF